MTARLELQREHAAQSVVDVVHGARWKLPGPIGEVGLVERYQCGDVDDRVPRQAPWPQLGGIRLLLEPTRPDSDQPKPHAPNALSVPLLSPSNGSVNTASSACGAFVDLRGAVGYRRCSARPQLPEQTIAVAGGCEATSSEPKPGQKSR